jgi:hypothetical protein
MASKGNSIITGTLLASVLLAPTVKSRLSGPADLTAANQTAAQNPITANGIAASLSSEKWHDKKHQEAENQASQNYADEFDRVLTAACPKKNQKGACEFQPADFIVAIVPDPIHTHLALRFDRQIEVLQEALQDAGYTYDRYIMPWDPQARGDSDDNEKHLAAIWYQEARERYPGLMVFRGDHNHPEQRLFVLLVTETPTRGIRRHQFLKAIEAISQATKKDLSRPESWGWMQSDPQCRKQDKGNESPPCVPLGLRIVGPTFSGSLSSLQQVLSCIPSAHGGCALLPFVSIHANVASHGDISSFEEQMQPRDVHLASFTESSDVVTERFIEYLAGTAYLQEGESRKYKTKNIAMLSEDESTYGAFGSTSQPAPSDSQCDEEGNAKNQECMLKLYFPREISQLRAAYQKDVGGESDSNGSSLPRDILRASPDVPGSSDDTVPVYSAKQMPLSQEAVMLGIVSEIRRHNSQYILIRATDPLDQLFLARYLRTQYPQARVVTIGADMLLRRESEDPRLHGVLALASYSVVPKANQNFLSSQHHIERVFPSSTEVATYNAMRSLLTAWVTDDVKICEGGQDLKGIKCRHALMPHRQEGNDKAQPLMLYQYGWSYEVQNGADKTLKAESPPVRLLALGRDDYWPIATLGPYSGEPLSSTLPRVRDQLKPHPEPVEIPSAWRMVQLLGIALGLGFTVCLWFSSVMSNSQILAKYAPAEQDSRCWVIVIAGLALILSLRILLWSWRHGAHSKNQSLEWVVFGITVLVGAAVLIELLSRWILSFDSGRSGSFPDRVWGLAPTVVFLVSVVFIVGLTRNHTSETLGLLLRYSTLRATQLASGLSFIMPLLFLLAAWLWWADHMIAGSVLLDERRPRLPDGMKNHRVMGLTRQALGVLPRVYDMRSGMNMRAWVIVLLGLGAFWILGDHQHPIHTLERPFISKALTIFLALGFAGIVAATLKLSEIWVATRQLLVALDSTPLRRGFKRIQGFSWDPIWQLGGGSLDEFKRMFSREKEALECVLATTSITQTNPEERLAPVIGVWNELNGIRHPFTFDWWRRRKAEVTLIRQFGVYQKEVGDVAGAALDYIADWWSQQKEPTTPSEEDADHAPPEVRACERFVCLLYINFLLIVLVRIRTFIMALGGMYVLTLLAISQYPFEPKGALQIALVLLLAFVVFVVGSVYAQIHRDAVLSAITKSDPGELGLDFWMRMVSFTALPLFSLVASQFPSLNRMFYSWFQPAIQAMNR